MLLQNLPTFERIHSQKSTRSNFTRRNSRISISIPIAERRKPTAENNLHPNSLHLHSNEKVSAIFSRAAYMLPSRVFLRRVAGIAAKKWRRLQILVRGKGFVGNQLDKLPEPRNRHHQSLHFPIGQIPASPILERFSHFQCCKWSRGLDSLWLIDESCKRK